MKRLLIVIACLATALFSSSSILAANVHFKSGPVFTDNGTTLTASGALAGLGNGDVTINLAATGFAVTSCTNPAGNVAPGQNKPRLNLIGSQSIPASKVKNGNVSFNVTTTAPSPISARAAGCPNNNWTATIVDVVFQSATITVIQGGQTVLSKTYSL
jgi:hypothetical protein